MEWYREPALLTPAFRTVTALNAPGGQSGDHQNAGDCPFVDRHDQNVRHVRAGPVVQRDDIDFIHTATPWEWHVPVMLAALKAGKHVSSECPFGMTLKELWELVDASEASRRHCLQLENCNYGYTEMLVNRMVHAGKFGEPLHAAAAYLHDLREILFEDRDEGLWRRAWHTRHNANLYPTHGLGPVAQCMNINRGDRFDYLVSMSGPSRGLQLWQQEHLDKDDPRRAEKYVLGDINVSLIKTAKGNTIYLVHDTNLPRPYSRIHIVQGTRGLFEGYPNRAYIEGRGRADQWVDATTLLAEFEHPLWKEIAEQARGAGHGGMDFIEDYRLIKCLREGKPLDMTVYDAAALSAVVGLSVESVAKNGQPVKVPDFTRGRWQTTPPLDIVHM